MFLRAFDRVSNFLKSIKSRDLRLAWLVAIAADAIQLGALPLFVAGGLSPADALLDVAVGAILIRLLGWHWAFLPSLVAELVPGFDLFPTGLLRSFTLRATRSIPPNRRSFPPVRLQPAVPENV